MIVSPGSVVVRTILWAGPAGAVDTEVMVDAGRVVVRQTVLGAFTSVVVVVYSDVIVRTVVSVAAILR